jgi:hypothetical protein
LLFCAAHLSFSQPSRNLVINPTGTYVFKGDRHKSEIKGNLGEVRAKLIDDTLVAIAMYSNTGYLTIISLPLQTLFLRRQQGSLQI